MKIKLDKRDKLFSKLVRERANWTCEVHDWATARGRTCRGYHPEGSRQAIHCSHIHSRRKRSVRWWPDNGTAMCFGCHQWLGENPVEFYQWAVNHLGPVRFENLIVRANTIMHFSKPQLEDLYQDMEAAYAHLLERRRAGETGRLEFEL